jgi:GNAT superfamily N-acetyltransferase
VRLVRELAAYERAPADRVRLTEADVLRDGFGDAARFEVLLAELDGDPVGFALFFERYSTWEGRPGLWVEDIFLEERARRRGLGRELMAEIARTAEARGFARLELSVLGWNPARDFYQRLGFSHLEGWLPYRLDRAGIRALARERP